MRYPKDNEAGGRIIVDYKRSLDPSDFDSLVTNLNKQTAVSTGPLG